MNSLSLNNSSLLCHGIYALNNFRVNFIIGLFNRQFGALKQLDFGISILAPEFNILEQVVYCQQFFNYWRPFSEMQKRLDSLCLNE